MSKYEVALELTKLAYPEATAKNSKCDEPKDIGEMIVELFNYFISNIAEE